MQTALRYGYMASERIHSSQAGKHGASKCPLKEKSRRQRLALKTITAGGREEKKKKRKEEKKKESERKEWRETCQAIIRIQPPNMPRLPPSPVAYLFACLPEK
ncbi:hypothetical protein CDAR_18551 [Caerostris darwini]|uniref:Uncharacterized protein n=1 Tax=Caerostris darwini TaxID=1538125 RepID=A0AAV4VAZ7_9ARAC|nr:hypothetical protein CDAR_18551 [Caerostris darwini]